MNQVVQSCTWGNVAHPDFWAYIHMGVVVNDLIEVPGRKELQLGHLQPFPYVNCLKIGVRKIARRATLHYFTVLLVVIVDHFFKNVSHGHVIYQKKGNFIPYSKLKTDLKNINLKRNDGEKIIMKI